MATITGDRIRRCRRSLDMTQEELAKKIGVTKATINKYETGITPNLKRPRIEAIAKALDVSPEYLMCWSDSPGRPLTFEDITKEELSLQDSMTGRRHPIVEMGYAVDGDLNKIVEVNPEEKNPYHRVITEGDLRNEEVELLKIFRSLDLRGRTKLLSQAFELESEQRKMK